jgi:hypothetical protein
LRRNALDHASAAALAGLTGLQTLGLGRLTPWERDLVRESSAACAASVAALPPSLRVLSVAHVGRCAEGAALVVPPGRAQQLELRSGCMTGRPRKGDTPAPDRLRRVRAGDAAEGDIRAFFGWHRGFRFDILILGALVGGIGAGPKNSPYIIPYIIFL